MTDSPRGLVRWPNRRTSGRYVYATFAGDEWWWECNLCGAPDESGGPYPSQPEAFAAALAHVPTCQGGEIPC